MSGLETDLVLARRVLKDGQTYLVAGPDGDVDAACVDGQGLYFQDTRFLSRFSLEVGGSSLSTLSAANELNFIGTFQFANGRITDDGGRLVAEAHTISIRRNRFLSQGLHERVGFVNYNPHTVRLKVRVLLGSDFRDMFEVRGYAQVVERGVLLPPRPLSEGDGVLLGYQGRDAVERRSRIRFEPAPLRLEVVPVESQRGEAQASSQWFGRRHPEPLSRREVITDVATPGSRSARDESGGERDVADRQEPDLQADMRLEPAKRPPLVVATYEIDLPRMESRSITIQVQPEIEVKEPGLTRGAQQTANVQPQNFERQQLDTAFLRLRGQYEEWNAECTLIRTDNETFDRLLARAQDDLRLLTDSVIGDLVPTAGIPWFAVPFGRDSLITGMQTLLLRPALLRGTLRYLAARQGTVVDDFRDEEPGKILHEVRLGELARLGEVPHTRYFGSVDSTPLFLVALGEYIRWTNDLPVARELLPAAEAALRWIDAYGDLDGDGLVEYRTRSRVGIRNQGWKDSADSVTHRDGTLAEPPVALCEVQGYVYAAHCAMAHIYDLLGQPQLAVEQQRRAAAMQQRVLSTFAMCDDQERPFWAMALDGQKQQVQTVTSNPGHLLWSGLLNGELSESTANRLLESDLLSGWGVRTLSFHEVSYNPMSYHNGSIWPHDNALVALGLKRTGSDRGATDVASQVLESGLIARDCRLPELFCGFPRDRLYHSPPAQYPVSCSPQAWAAGSVFMFLQALLGLEVNSAPGSLQLRPLLPPWLNNVSISRMSVGRSRVSVSIRRAGSHLEVDVLESGGFNLEVSEANS
jgi:glycogen debranching enzyme